MKQVDHHLVFVSGEYEALMNAAEAYRLSNYEGLNEAEHFLLQELRVAVLGRLIAEREGLLEHAGIFYKEHRERVIQRLDEDPPEPDGLTKDLMAEALLALPDQPDQAMSLEVPYTSLLRDCILWASKSITSRGPAATKVLDTFDPERREHVAGEIDYAGMQTTVWAYDLGLRTTESLVADGSLFDS